MCKLSRKQFLFIKTLWNSRNRTADIETIEAAVWKDAGTTARPFITKHTILTLVHRAHEQVRRSAFPYEIETLKVSATVEIQGYQLVQSLRTENHYR